MRLRNFDATASTASDGRREGPTRLVIVGAGGFGREVLGYAQELRARGACLDVVGFLDDNPMVDLPYRGAPHLGRIADYVVTDTVRFVVAVGDPARRAETTALLAERDARFFTIVHPTAHVATTATIGEGCIIGPMCAIGNEGFVDDHAILTSYAAVGHDAYVGRTATLSPHTVVNGGSEVGDGVFLGSHASVNPGLEIGSWSKISAGTVVYADVEPGSLVSGNPATAVAMGYHVGRNAFGDPV